MLHKNFGPLSNFVFPDRAGGGDGQPTLPLNLVCFDAWQALLKVSFGTQVNPILVTSEHLCLSLSLPKASTCCLSWLLSPLRTALCSLHPFRAPVPLGKRWTDCLQCLARVSHSASFALSLLKAVLPSPH